MIGARLVLRHPYGDEPIKRFWDCGINDDGSLCITFRDLADALEIMRGSYVHRLEIQTADGTKQLRTLDQLSQALQAEGKQLRIEG